MTGGAAAGQWDIDVLGVQALLTRAGTCAADLGTAAQSFAADIQVAAAVAGSAVVANALSDFVAARGPDLTVSADLIVAAERAVVASTIAYASGDLEMARNVQSGLLHQHVPRVPERLPGGLRAAF
jgi:hypothetical protein